MTTEFHSQIKKRARKDIGVSELYTCKKTSTLTEGGRWIYYVTRPSFENFAVDSGST